MDRDPAITSFSVSPDYGRGFVFHWSVAGWLEDPSPWTFTVQFGDTVNGPWHDLSPGLENAFAYRKSGRVRVGKAQSLFFRLVLDTQSGRYETDARMPYGDLTRSEFLLGREIMRREVLHMSKMAGVECLVMNAIGHGPRCPKCIDPITGQSRDGHCRLCHGTGRFPAYGAPVSAWCLFSEDSHHETAEGPEGNGVVENKPFSVRTVYSVPVRKNDVIRDVRTGKMYYVNSAQVAAELRRVPLVQTLVVSEAATTDPVYSMEVGHVA